MSEKSKWTIPSRIADVIEQIEQQLPGSELNTFGVKEHRYVLRGMFKSFCEVRELEVTTPVLAKDGKPVLENGVPKIATAKVKCWVLTPDGDKTMAEFMKEQSNFVCYASNAKKLLADTYPKLKDEKAAVADYE